MLEQLEANHWGYWGLGQGGIYFYSSSTRSINFFGFATRKLSRIATTDRPSYVGSSGFSVSPDGRWILLAQEDIAASDIMLVKNFRW